MAVYEFRLTKITTVESYASARYEAGNVDEAYEFFVDEYGTDDDWNYGVEWFNWVDTTEVDDDAFKERFQIEDVIKWVNNEDVESIDYEQVLRDKKHQKVHNNKIFE